MKKGILALAATFVVFGLGPALHALYVRVETKKVPVSRLAARLEADVAADPRNIQTRVNLARLYGMAYALRSEEVPSATLRGEEKPWYGHEPALIPYKSDPLKAGETDVSSAREYLKKAIAQYEAALALDPGNLLARLGHGWMLEQAGEKDRAIVEYRKVIADAWPKESKSAAGSFRPFFTHEAASYLIPLLDRRRDAAEIEELRTMQLELSKKPRPITPIAIPLQDRMRPHDVIDETARVRFDADGSGIPVDWTWISPDAGWLVYDADGKGQITSALQWFGNVTFWLFWQNGYQPLAALDDNRDGEISGTELERLAVWRDANQNGVSEPGEVRALAVHGIEALSYQYVTGDGVRLAAHSPAGVRLWDGRHRPTYDVILRSHRDMTD